MMLGSTSHIYIYTQTYNMIGATSHRGDGDNDPPRRNNNLERGHNISQPSRKGGRGPTTNNRLRRMVAQMGPLPIEFDISVLGTGRPIGEHKSLCINMLAGVVRDPSFPKHYISWNKVPEDEKDKIWTDLQDYFRMDRWLDGERNQKSVEAGVNSLCAHRWRNAKSDQKKYFTNNNGYELANNLRDTPPPNVEQHIWDPFVDLMLSSGFRRRSEANKRNRAQMHYPSTHGSRSITDRLTARNPPGLIETFKNNHTYHTKRGGGWCGPDNRAEEQYVNMGQIEPNCRLGKYWSILNEMLDMKRDHPEMSEEDILLSVLKPRCRHRRGVGHALPGYVPTSSSSSTSTGRARRPPPEPKNSALLKQAMIDTFNFSGIPIPPKWQSYLSQPNDVEASGSGDREVHDEGNVDPGEDDDGEDDDGEDGEEENDGYGYDCVYVMVVYFVARIAGLDYIELARIAGRLELIHPSDNRKSKWGPLSSRKKLLSSQKSFSDRASGMTIRDDMSSP
ncbi:uncharacterized protein [Rutidosis leptorrhynchoides]|uniref:uncharacterized protein n=1 Tax=Rutidosis leptorrhynchoides TaxID=125765 RepID=UPI003A9A658D